MVTSVASPAASRTCANQVHMRGETSRGRGPKGRKYFQRTPQHSVKSLPHITCWGCGGPHYQCDCLELQTGNNHREGKAPMGGASSHHRIYVGVDNQQVEHQSFVVETLGLKHGNHHGRTITHIGP